MFTKLIRHLNPCTLAFLRYSTRFLASTLTENDISVPDTISVTLSALTHLSHTLLGSRMGFGRRLTRRAGQGDVIRQRATREKAVYWRYVHVLLGAHSRIYSQSGASPLRLSARLRYGLVRLWVAARERLLLTSLSAGLDAQRGCGVPGPVVAD